MSRVFVIFLCLIIIFWSVPQINQVSAGMPSCSNAKISPQIFYFWNNDWVEKKDNAPVPEGLDALYFYFTVSDDVMKQNKLIQTDDWRIYIQSDAFGGSGGSSTIARFNGNTLQVTTNNKDLLKATNNSYFKTYLQNRSSGFKDNPGENEAVCRGLDYKVGYVYSRETCTMTLSADPVATEQTIVVKIENAPPNYDNLKSINDYYLYQRGLDAVKFYHLDGSELENVQNPDERITRPKITIDHSGSAQFTFTAPNLPKLGAGLALGETIRTSATTFCATKPFNINLATEPMKDKIECYPSKTNASILDEMSVTAINVKPGHSYWVRRSDKDNKENNKWWTMNLNKTETATGNTINLWLNEDKSEEPPTIKKFLPEGTYTASIYDVTQTTPVCTTKEFNIGEPKAAPGVVKECGDGNNNTVICAKGAGKPVGACSDPKDPGYDPKNPGIATAIGCIRSNPPELVKSLMTFTVGIGGGLAFLMMLFGAFQMLTSAGNPETLNAGKDRLTNAVIGLLFIIFAVLLMQIIGVDILKIPGFDR